MPGRSSKAPVAATIFWVAVCATAGPALEPAALGVEMNEGGPLDCGKRAVGPGKHVHIVYNTR